MIENIPSIKFGTIAKVLNLFRTIYKCIKKHRVIMSIPSKHISQDDKENKTRFLLNIENKTLNTIKLISLKYLTEDKKRGQIGVTTPRVAFSGNRNESYYISQELFFDSKKMNCRIDADSNQKIRCYIPKTNDIIRVRLVYASVGVVKRFKKREIIYLES